MNFFKLAVVLSVILGALYGWRHRAIHQPEGVLVAITPKQTSLPDAKPIVFKIAQGVVEPLAEYDITARILSTERYWMDTGASISPIDLAVGWGPMSDSSLINKLKIQQYDRFYFYSWSGNDSIDPIAIKNNSANMHIIPANDYIRDSVLALRVGQVVRLKGYLVRVSRKDGGEWVSSLSREDSGAGACELMWVESLSQLTN